MPLYDYECTQCHSTISMLRPMAERHAKADCTVCNTGQLHFRLSAPGTIMSKAGAFRAATPQQQLAGSGVSGPGTRRKTRTSVLHQCIGPNCSVCA